MIENLSSRPSIDHETLRLAMRELVERIFVALDGDTVLDDCLDAAEAFASGRCVVHRPEHAALGLLAALAVTLHDGPRHDGRRTVLYVDLRDPRKFLHASHVDFFMTASLLLGAVLEAHRKGEASRATPALPHLPPPIEPVWHRRRSTRNKT